MSRHLHHSLTRLVDLKSRALESAQTRWAEQQSLSQRIETNIARLEALARTSVVAAGTCLPSLMVNGGAYKEAMLGWAEDQRAALAQSRADTAAAHADVLAAARREKALREAKDRVALQIQGAQTRDEQKAQDDLGTQVWLRGGRR